MNTNNLPETARNNAIDEAPPIQVQRMPHEVRTAEKTPMMAERRFIARWGIAVAIAAGAVLLLYAFWASQRASATGGQPGDDDAPPEAVDHVVQVKTIQPRQDPSFQIAVAQPAYVDPYFQADLMARVAGPIKFLEVDIGDRVKAGQVLVRVDVPDLEEDVLQRETIIAQRQKELSLARAFEKSAAAGVELARSVIPEKESERQRAESIRSFREKELRRFRGLALGNSPGVTADIVDERTQYYEAAVADLKAADAAVEKARAGLMEADAKLDAAHADVSLKSALVDVARKDRDRAGAMLSFATLTAPFDGVVTRRNVDPGSFVQNSTTARTEPMLTICRTDIVTVYMKLPDNYAPFVSKNTDALIEMGVLPGWKIRGRVTRFSPSLKTPEHDRTMRVEVDLFNGSPAEYEQFVGHAKASNYAGIKSRTLPVFPIVNGQRSTGLDGRLLPGMFGTMKLTLQKFHDARLVPSTAIVSQGGRYFVYLVKDNKAVLVPVDVQVDDGRLAKISLIETVAGQQVRRPLTGEETVVVTNQGELSDGQSVKATPVEW